MILIPLMMHGIKKKSNKADFQGLKTHVSLAELFCRTRMHSSRMRTARSLTASCSICWGRGGAHGRGVHAQGGMHTWGCCVSLVSGGCACLGGIHDQGVHMPGGMCAQWVCMPGGMHAQGCACMPRGCACWGGMCAGGVCARWRCVCMTTHVTEFLTHITFPQLLLQVVINKKQECIPIGCVPPLWWLPLNVSTGGCHITLWRENPLEGTWDQVARQEVTSYPQKEHGARLPDRK